jgi:hypothetical protein
MYFLNDLAQFAEQEEKKKPGRFIAPGLAIAGGGIAGTLGTSALVDNRKVRNIEKASRSLERMNKIENISRDINSGIRPKTRIKMDRKADKLFEESQKHLLSADKLKKTYKRNVALGALGGAALGYGAYRGGKALVNKLRKKESK